MDVVEHRPRRSQLVLAQILNVLADGRMGHDSIRTSCLTESRDDADNTTRFTHPWIGGFRVWDLEAGRTPTLVVAYNALEGGFRLGESVMDLVKREREVLRVSFVQGLIIGTSSKEKIGARAAKKKKN